MRSIRARRSGILSGLITRFAPSPTGDLHPGHALSALAAYRLAEESGGRFLLRLEDIDPERCRPEYEWAIYEDLAWLGLKWEPPVSRQSEHMAEYAGALERLKVIGVVYRCFCSRKLVAEVVQNESLYPCICRRLSRTETEDRLASGEKPCWRMDATKATAVAGPLSWWDRNADLSVRPDAYGDVVVARRKD